MMRRWGVLLGLVVGTSGCAASPGSGMDAGRDAGRVDAGSRDAGDPFRDASGRTDAEMGIDADVTVDAGIDAGAEDAGVDAGSSDAGSSDAPTPLEVDGVVSDAEWMGATVLENTVATNWGAAQNRLDALRTIVDGGRLWIAVEGLVETTNAIVVYVDTDLVDTTTGLPSFASLTDAMGSLDNALSANFTVPANFYVDYAWGTRAMGTDVAPLTNDTMSGFDERIGWKDVVMGAGADFSWIGHGDAPVACGASACETSIALSRLGATSGDQIAMFVRLTNAEGTAFDSRQRLPEDGMALDTQDVGMVHVVTVP
jgi:hypothetical protein